MKKMISVAILCCFAFAAQADIAAENPYFSEAQALTRAVPTSASFVSGTALRLDNLNGYSIMLCAASGQTLSGAGSLQAYKFDDRRGLVSRNPSRDLPVTVTSTSCQGAACRCQNWDDVPLADGLGWALFAATGVTVSSGTVTVFYSGYKKLR